MASGMPLPGRSMSALKPPSAPPPAVGGDDAAAEEQGETCKASVTSDQVDELKTNGTLTVQADSGETVVLTLAAGGEDEGAA